MDIHIIRVILIVWVNSSMGLQRLVLFGSTVEEFRGALLLAKSRWGF